MRKKTKIYDALVVGSGASGGWVAKALTERGMSVLVLEAGPPRVPTRDFTEHVWPYRVRFRGFGDTRSLLEKQPVAVLAAAAPPDEHGYFSLGIAADYAAALIGRVPFVLEVNDQLPRTSGANRLHHSEVTSWCRHSTPLVEVPAAGWSGKDEAIAQAVAERIPDGATIQLGIGSIPTAVASARPGSAAAADVV